MLSVRKVICQQSLTQPATVMRLIFNKLIKNLKNLLKWLYFSQLQAKNTTSNVRIHSFYLFFKAFLHNHNCYHHQYKIKLANIITNVHPIKVAITCEKDQYHKYKFGRHRVASRFKMFQVALSIIMSAYIHFYKDVFILLVKILPEK